MRKVKSHKRKSKNKVSVVRSHYRKGKDGKKYDMRTHTMHGVSFDEADRDQLKEEYSSGNKKAFYHLMNSFRVERQHMKKRNTDKEDNPLDAKNSKGKTPKGFKRYLKTKKKNC